MPRRAGGSARPSASLTQLSARSQVAEMSALRVLHAYVFTDTFIRGGGRGSNLFHKGVCMAWLAAPGPSFGGGRWPPGARPCTGSGTMGSFGSDAD